MRQSQQGTAHVSLRISSTMARSSSCQRFRSFSYASCVNCCAAVVAFWSRPSRSVLKVLAFSACASRLACFSIAFSRQLVVLVGGFGHLQCGGGSGHFSGSGGVGGVVTGRSPHLWQSSAGGFGCGAGSSVGMQSLPGLLR